MTLKISHSSVSVFSECGRKYDLRYNKNLRSKMTSSAFTFGIAIDNALNHLLKTKNLDDTLALFDLAWETQHINKVSVDLRTTYLVTYPLTDFDPELLFPEDYEFYQKTCAYLEFDYPDLETNIKYFQSKKKARGFQSLETFEKQLLNLGYWLCVRRKGHIILKSYEKKVLPLIKEVLTIQKKGSLKNELGDEIQMYLDFIVEFHDGKRFLLDNKTSSIKYEQDSPGKSQQLVLYYYSEKDEFKLDGVGFAVMYKKLLMNRKKICSVCKFDGSGTRHNNCSDMSKLNPKGKPARCGGDWVESIDPECDIDLILNDNIPPEAEDKVIETFDNALEGIKAGEFQENRESCVSVFGKCSYYNYCHKNSMEDLVKV